MSQVVASIGGMTPAQLGLHTLRDSQRPVAPGTVDTTVSMPGMHGAYDFGATLGPLPLPLDCAFATSSAYELQRLVSKLAQLLIDGNGRPRTLALEYSNRPGQVYYVRYSGTAPIQRIVGLGRFTLPMVAFDPFAYTPFDTSEINVDTKIPVDMALSVDASYGIALTSPGVLVVDNFGTQDARPIIEVAGSFTSLTVTLGGKTTTYSQPHSGTITLDFAKRIARSGAVNVFSNTNRTFGSLPVGKSDVAIGGTGINITVRVKFKAKFI